jgi:hypothetical protein
MGRRARCAIVTIVVLVGGGAVGSGAVGGHAYAQPNAPETDSKGTAHAGPELLDDVDVAMSRHVEGQRDQLVAVEALTDDNAAVERAVNRAGGTVTGSVAGQLVQALVPAGAVGQLSTERAVTFLQRPVRINRIPAAVEGGFGTSVGAEATVINATAWHDAGITGNVRVGIIDFFDLDLWNTAEHGDKPDAAHQFCLDSTGFPLCNGGQIDPAAGDPHGVAVAEIVKDMAPGAELFIASTGTTADTQAAIDWFAANGVHIVTRSLGAPYDGPGDGSGPLDSVVDYAVARGITWFNSGGNDAAYGYGRYTDGVDGSGYVDFDNGPGVHTTLRIDRTDGGVAFDGIRWANDWNLPASRVTDYSVEVYIGTSESAMTRVDTYNRSQVDGDVPLEAVDLGGPLGLGQAIFIRIHADAHYNGPDIVEVATFLGMIDASYRSAAYSGAKPVVDSRNQGLVAVGAVDPANGSNIAYYSSQGPTNDGRIKPDVSAPSCIVSTIYVQQCFAGTSAASPAAAGMAAVLLSRGLALPGVALGALVRHLVRDLGPPGPTISTVPAKSCCRPRRKACRHCPLHSPRSARPFGCSTPARRVSPAPQTLSGLIVRSPSSICRSRGWAACRRPPRRSPSTSPRPIRSVRTSSRRCPPWPVPSERSRPSTSLAPT